VVIGLGNSRYRCGFAKLHAILFRRGDQPILYRLLPRKLRARRAGSSFLASPSPKAFSGRSLPYMKAESIPRGASFD